MSDFPDPMPEGVACRLYYRGPVQAVIDVYEPRDPFDVLQQVANRFCETGLKPGITSHVSQLPPPGKADTARASTPPGGSPSGVRDTSVRAYRALRYSGKLTAQQTKIMRVFLQAPAVKWTRQELARATGLGINVICGRVDELKREPHALLVEHEEKTCTVTAQRVNALELA